MTENFLQILLYLFQHHVSQGGLEQTTDRESLVEELDHVGFNPLEARHAIEWLDGFQQTESAVKVVGHPKETSIRAFTEFEIFKLDIRVRGFILFLQQNGLLDDVKREIVIERAMSLNIHQVKLYDLYYIVNVVLIGDKTEDQVSKQKQQLLLATVGKKH